MSRIINLVSSFARRSLLIALGAIALASCVSGNELPPPTDPCAGKLTHSGDGIPGSYIVTLRSGAGEHVMGEAYAIAFRYGGTVSGVMDQFGMFSIHIDDARACKLAEDSRIENVTQDATVRLID